MAEEYIPDWAKGAAPAASDGGGGSDYVPDWAPKPSVAKRIGESLDAGFKSANLEGFGGLVARKGFEWSGYGIDKLKEAYPGKDDAWYKSKQKAIINQTMLDARKEQHGRIEDADINIPGTKINPLAFAGGVFGGADPTYAVGGGIARNIVGSGLKKAAARTAVNAGEQAVLGAATDAAYQAADIADGLQKDFDIERNLANVAFGAGFGGVQGIAHEVSPFVKELFKKRGTDTTPGAEPVGNNTSTTGAEPIQPLKTKYEEVLKTGSAEDIHNLFKGSNVPAPWRADIAKFVEKRDGGAPTPDLDIGGGDPQHLQGSPVWDKTSSEGAAIRALDQASPDPHLPQERPLEPSQIAQDSVEGVRPTQVALEPVVASTAYSPETATGHVQTLTRGWKNAPEFEIVGSPEHIADPSVRDYVLTNDSDGRALGLYGKDGKVRIFSDRIVDEAELNSIVYHEALGHYGLAQKFGERLDKDLNTLMTRNVGQFGKKVDAWMKENPGEYGGDRTRAAEEVLARDSEKGQINQSVADALVATIRDFGRQSGLKLAYSDADIRTILAMAHSAVVDGKGRNVGLNGFRVQPASQAENKTRLAGDFTDPNGSFMKRSDNPKDIAEEAYEWLSMGYVAPKPRSWETTTKMAYEAGITPEALKKRRGVGNLDKDIFIASRAAEMAEADLMALSVKQNSPEGLSTADFEKAIETTAHFQYALGRLNNDISQVGRALNAVKAVRLTKNNLRRLQEMLDGTNMEAMADPEFMGNFLKQYANLVNSGNGAGARSMLRGINTPYWWQYILSARQNMLLSGLSTHLKASYDMSTTMGRELIEATMALPAGMVRAGLQSMGVNVKSGMTPAAYGMKIWGLARAGMDASTYKGAADTLVHGGISRYGASQDARVPVLSKVSDALAAQDVFFRSFFENSNLYYLGALKAEAELKASGVKYSQDDVMSLGSSYAQTPSISMRAEAVELAENSMLVNKSRINTAIDQAKLIRPNMNAGEQAWKFLINLFTPFIRTSANGFANQIIRRSPLALLDHLTIADLKAGGAKADVALARMTLGTAVLGSYWVAAGDKDKYKDDGADLSPAKYAELGSGGKSFNSIKSDDSPTEYNRTSNLNLSMNPFGKDNSTFLMVQGLRNAWEKGAEADDVLRGLKLALYKIGATFAEQTFVSNLGDPVTALNSRGGQQESKLDQVFADTARTMLPNLGVQAANIVDPNQHDIKDAGLMGIIKDNVPGMSGGLPIKHDVYGEPKQTGTSVTGVPTWVSKGNRTKETTDPATLELVRLAERVPAAVVSPVPQSITQDGVKIKLTRQQFQDYQRDAGQGLVAGVRELVESGVWEDMSDKERVKATKKIQTEARKEAKEALFPIGDDSWMTSKQIKALPEDSDD